MGTKKENTKKKIMDVTIKLLEELENPEDITIRKISEAAGIGVGLINYHYGTRANLISEAISMKMENLATIMEQMGENLDDPLKYLKDMLVKMSDIGMKDCRLNRFSAEYDLLKGNFKICLYLLPVLNKIFEGRKSDTEKRLIAYQIIVITQSIYLRQDAFHMLTGIDIDIKSERDNLIHTIVDNLIKEGEKA